jgi:hypothetical protein
MTCELVGKQTPGIGNIKPRKSLVSRDVTGSVGSGAADAVEVGAGVTVEVRTVVGDTVTTTEASGLGVPDDITLPPSDLHATDTPASSTNINKNLSNLIIIAPLEQ